MRNFLKNIKLNENNMSMLLGAAVIVVVGFLIVNYFKNLNDGETSTVGTATNLNENKLPAKYTVKSGDSLWSIAEKYYQSGYNWVDIQKANSLSDASKITVGQELTIPDVTPKLAGQTNKQTADATITATLKSSATPQPTATVKPTLTPAATAIPSTATTPAPATITGTTYTVAKGDSLWTIAQKAYGDGFQWKKIADANKLKNPRVIHTGNTLTLPR